MSEKAINNDQLYEMWEWIQDNIPVYNEVDFSNVTDAEIIRAINEKYTGGTNQFMIDYNLTSDVFKTK